MRYLQRGLVAFVVLQTCHAALHNHAMAAAKSRRRNYPPQAGLDLSEIGSDVLRAAEMGANAVSPILQEAVPVVQSGVQQAAPVVAGGVVKAAALAGQAAGRAAVGIDAALPVIGKAAESTLPVIGKAAETTLPVLGQAAESTNQLLRSSLTPEQQQQLETATRVAGQAGNVVGGVAVSTSKATLEAVKFVAPVLQQGLKVGVEQGVPLAGEVVKTVGSAVDQGVKGAAPIVDEYFRSGSLRPETVDSVRSSGLGALNEGVRDVARGLRGVANIVAPEQPSVVGASGRGGGPLPGLPSTRDVTDSMATSLVQAAAPYAFGAFLLSLALSALRELLEPLEQVVRNALAVAILVVIGKIVYENWDAIYKLYLVVST